MKSRYFAMKRDGPPKLTTKRDSFAESHATQDETRLTPSDGADLVSCESNGCDRPDFVSFLPPTGCDKADPSA